MPRRRHLLLGSAVTLLAGAAVRAADAPVLVVAAPGARPPALGLAELAQVYRRQRSFIDGQRVQPVNLPAAHPLRRWFSQQVLGQTPEEMEAWWRDRYFNGVLPPFVLASEEAVLRWVAATPGAIGYVSACAADRRVRTLLQLDGGPACGRS